MTMIALSAQAQDVAENDSVASDSTTVLTSTLVVPNAFSPNHDQINDVFKVKSYQNIVEFHAYIFNRWGQKLYEWTNIDGGWDGTYRGNDVKQGTYFVLVKAKGADGETYNIRKDVNLLRGYIEGTSISQ
jgi:gliding motility-associated-like protein